MKILERLQYWREKYLPYLVWRGSEIDVLVTFSEDRLRATSVEGAAKQFGSGPLREIENKLSELGVDFDSGLGHGGRDWEWDWSLRGPISVTFKRPCERPERREK